MVADFVVSAMGSADLWGGGSSGFIVIRRILTIGIGLAVLGAFLGGCAESVSETTVGDDGSVVKVITIKEGSMSGAMNMGEEEPKPLTDLVKLQGEGWTVKEEVVEGSRVFTAMKRISDWRNGESSWSLVLNDKSSISARSQISESEGSLNFEESYNYVGDVDLEKREKEMALLQNNLKQIWMKGELSDADAEGLSLKIRPVVNRILFGPSEPILPLLLTSPKRFEREFRIKISDKISALFLGVNGMSEAEAREHAKKLLDVMNAQDQVENPADDPGAMASEDESASENSYSISVSFKGPGVAEHNGLLDPVADEVYWDFYSMAVEEAPVLLKVRFRQ